MACVEGALKGSFRKEMALKSNHHQALLLEDLWTANGQSGVVVSVEDFSVDDLLDFSKMGGADEDEKEKTKEDEQDKSCVSLSSPHQQQQQQEHELTTKENSNNHGGNLGFKDDFGSSELSVPVDDVANLEWLSHFVEDSFTEYSLPFPAGNLTAKPKSTPEKKPTTTEEPPSMKNPCFATPVPAKARTKRTRTGGRRWSFGSTTESSSSSSSSSTTSTTSSPSTSWLIYTTPSHIVDSFNSLTRPPVKKQKRGIASESGGGGYVGGTSQPPRRCSHCGVQKTPQWRAGPQGAKTLCNACGVRYKSGRLLPEYRPACSPTFSSEVHSNHHRKVLEMRKKKEPVGSEPGLAPAVTSF